MWKKPLQKEIMGSPRLGIIGWMGLINSASSTLVLINKDAARWINECLS